MRTRARITIEPKRLVMTWVWGSGDYAGQETLVTVDLAADGDGTLLTLTHENLDGIESRDNHEHGWSGSFDRLQRRLGG